MALVARHRSATRAFCSVARVATVFSISALSVTSTLSIGVAVYPDDGRSPEDLLRRADAVVTAIHGAVDGFRGGTRSRGDDATMAVVPMPPDEQFGAVEATSRAGSSERIFDTSWRTTTESSTTRIRLIA